MLCKSDNHKLIEIMRDDYSSFGEERVVRWCRVCGAVVVDIDIDGRTDPGGVMKMQLPKGQV